MSNHFTPKLAEDVCHWHQGLAGCNVLSSDVIAAERGGCILQVRSLYGVPKDLLGLLEGRQTYVIGKDGTVKLVFNNQFQPEKHPQEALSALSN